MATTKAKPQRKKKPRRKSVQVVVTPFDLPAAIMSKVRVKGKATKLVKPKDSGQSFDNRVSHGEAPKWPMTSTRAGVNPSQAEQVNAMLKARGIVGARIDTKTGDAVFEGPNERRKYLKMMGQYDRSGYY